MREDLNQVDLPFAIMNLQPPAVPRGEAVLDVAGMTDGRPPGGRLVT